MLRIKYEILKTGLELLKDDSLVENIGIPTNAKLYDIMFLYCDMNDFEDKFYLFCDTQWGDFKNFMSENYCKIQQLSRTSSFYIVPVNSWLDYYYLEDYGKCRTSLQKKIMIINSFINNNISNYISIEDPITIFDECVQDVYDNWNRQKIIEDFKREFKNMVSDLKDIKNCYSYINKFKDNQVEYFKKFLEGLL